MDRTGLSHQLFVPEVIFHFIYLELAAAINFLYLTYFSLHSFLTDRSLYLSEVIFRFYCFITGLSLPLLLPEVILHFTVF
jgi:ABC-type uncharacterized transport system permease subunit